MSKVKVGIFFGGNSREREVSFAGGRTVYDNLDKSLFDAIPIFVDSFNNFILLDWKYIYKGSIRDFYPPVSALKSYKHPFQVYAENIEKAYHENGKLMALKIGKLLQPAQLPKLIDFAFLALHGTFGEDGSIQGLLEFLRIPYSGSGIMPSALGMNKAQQKLLMQSAGMPVPKYHVVNKSSLHQLKKAFSVAKETIGFPMVIKPANQGSSVGVTVLQHNDYKAFELAVKSAFFVRTITASEWKSLGSNGQFLFLQKLADVKEGIGLPAYCEQKLFYHPEELWGFLNKTFKTNKEVTLESIYSETSVLIEQFIEGREFSCIVVKLEDGTPVALPPTEIVKGKEVFDYRSKYLPGLSRKVTPIQLPDAKIEDIRKACEQLFEYFNFHVYARIDGFVTKAGQIYLNDPNTTSGMMPSSFFFHQAAEIGLNPSQFLTYIIRCSVSERMSSHTIHHNDKKLLDKIDRLLVQQKQAQERKKRVAVFMGGYSTERHISVESGRNIYEKLASSTKYQPFPVFVTGNDNAHELYLLPINIMLKDNADDIKEKVLQFKRAPIINKIARQCSSIINKYSNLVLFEPKKITYKQLGKMCDAVFIALHGRPGEDGTVQKELNKLNIPFNGSNVWSSQITINKFETNEILKKHGFLVADHLLVQHKQWQNNSAKVIEQIEKIGYPLIAKPADDGCSSAVKKIKNRSELLAYASGVFRANESIPEQVTKVLQLKPKEEFPQKNYFLIEKFVEKGNALHFLEITGGMLTHFNKGKVVIETFEPSETLAEGEILSLEEKFLAGQGQNLTPARYAANAKQSAEISKKVQLKLKEAAQVLNIEGYCRIDAFVRIYKGNRVEVVFIEVNSLPGMTPATAIFHQCALNGYKPYEFIDEILNYGEERTRKGLHKTKKVPALA